MAPKISVLSAVLGLLIVSCGAQNTNLDNLDVDDLVKKDFHTDPKKQPQTNKSCGFQKECVKLILCKDDTITSEGADLNSIRIDSSVNECGFLEKCCQTHKITTRVTQITEPKTHLVCGNRNPDGVGFLIDSVDNEAHFGEFPWMVAILREKIVGNDILTLYECGGALIAPAVILTASHCVQTRMANTLVVRAGEWDSQTEDEILPHQDRRVREIIVHEKYHKGALDNDIALLFLEQPFVLEENVSPVCLPDSNVRFDNEHCFATGWCKYKILRKINLPVVPNAQCQTNLHPTRSNRNFILDDSFICAGGEKNNDTCESGGGSPLVCPIPGITGRYYLAGILAWSPNCGENNIPDIYVNVPFLRKWVNEKLTAKGVDFAHFTA